VGASEDDYRRLMAAYPHRSLYTLVFAPITRYQRIAPPATPPATSGSSTAGSGG
jgi:hypothetical protein